MIGGIGRFLGRVFKGSAPRAPAAGPVSSKSSPEPQAKEGLAGPSKDTFAKASPPHVKMDPQPSPVDPAALKGPPEPVQPGAAPRPDGVRPHEAGQAGAPAPAVPSVDPDPEAMGGMRAHGDTNLRDLDPVRTWGDSRPDMPEAVARQPGGTDEGPLETRREGGMPEQPEAPPRRMPSGRDVELSKVPGFGGVASSEPPEEEENQPVRGGGGGGSLDPSKVSGHGGAAGYEPMPEEEDVPAMPIGSEDRTPSHPRSPQGTPTPDGVRPLETDVARQPIPRPIPSGESAARDLGRGAEAMSPPVGPDGPVPRGPGPLRPGVGQSSSQAAMPPVGEEDPENPEIRQSTAEGFRPRPEGPPRPEA